MIKRITVVMMGVVLWATMAQAGTRADLSGDAVVAFQTTMDMPFMTVGNPGNAGEQSRLGTFGDETYYGGVAYAYNIGKFEVTAGQYTEFLNAVASTGAIGYGLYSFNMMVPDPLWGGGCMIDRSGSPGNYTYSVAADYADRPVNYVSWGDAARFANWLTNGKPTGVQDLMTTEDGSYFLNGAVTNAELLAVTRRPDARYVIPTANEWYKAAYHANDGVTANYFDTPMDAGTAAMPSHDVIDPDPGNSGNFWLPDGDDNVTIGEPYWRTEVGEFENSASAYGTFDMGGNVAEWTEGSVVEYNNVAQMWLRGGAYYSVAGYMGGLLRFPAHPSESHREYGFRIAEVPEPATLSLLALALGGMALLRKKRQ